MNYGDTVRNVQTMMIDSIQDVAPVKWDGVEECYKVTDRAWATHMAIVTPNGLLLFSIDCENMYLLADAIVG